MKTVENMMLSLHYQNNYEGIRNLSEPELAWFLMSHSENCDLCAFHNENGCNKNADGKAEETCINGYQKWLHRIPTEQDIKWFAVAKHNRLVDAHNVLMK